MSKLGFSTMKTFDQLRLSSTGKPYQMQIMSRSSSDSISLGSFANLKLTAEKLVKEQASVKTDLHMANTKLKKSMDQIHLLEDKLQNAVNDNAKLKVKQKEEAKLWKGLESKFSSTKTLCDQLTETLQQLAGQVRDSEQDKTIFEDRLRASLVSFDNLHLEMTSLSAKLETTEDSIRKREQEMIELRAEIEGKEKIFMDENLKAANLISEKEIKIQGIESEAETFLLKKKELELLISTSEERIKHLSDVSTLSETKIQELLLKISTLQAENHDFQDKMQVKLQGKSEEVENLQKEITGLEEHVNSLEKQVSQLNESLEEKEQLRVQFTEKEKLLEQQRIEVQSSLAAAETTLAETKKHYDLMLEGKQLELTKHIKEISHRNDQAINDIRRKFELEKLEIVNLEKEKAQKTIGEMERKCESKLAENKEESRQCLLRAQEEHALLISNLRKEHEKKESDLRADHEKELDQCHIQAEEEWDEKVLVLKQEHDVQVKDLKRQHDDEYRRLEEELDLQRSKEERQRKLLKMQWKVMDGNAQEDQEVTSKKAYSTKRIDADGEKQRRLTAKKPQIEEKLINRTDSPYLIGTQTPIANLMKKAEIGNPGSMISMPKHSRKVTHREYEVETTNGRTITKRKTKSTVMFDDSKKQKRTPTPKAKNVKEIVKVPKGGVPPRPSKNIGDLFSEGSLNPYTDDPYAFD